MKKTAVVAFVGLVVLLAGLTSLCDHLRHHAQHAAPVVSDLKNPAPEARRADPGPQELKAVPAPRTKAQSSAESGLKLPLEFEANRGQADEAYGFVAHGSTYGLGLSATDIALSLHRPRKATPAKLVTTAFEPGPAAVVDHSQLHLRLLDANESASLTGLMPKPGVSNYFVGSDPSKWTTGVPHFGEVEAEGVYKGIDLVFYGNPQQLEYDFRVAPGADPRAIRLGVSDATSTMLDAEGNLVLGTAMGDVQLKHPEAYQEVDGVRTPVHSEFYVAGKSTVEFVVGAYDRTRPLVIDPVLLYSVSIGGSNGNQAYGLDIDAAGDAYVTGNTCSSDFPATAGNQQNIHSNIDSVTCQDAFVLKMDPTGSSLIYSDFIGGSLWQSGAGIAVDSSGDAFVTGITGSSDFPTVNNIGPSGPLMCSLTHGKANCPIGFIFKLSPDGSQLLFSSLLGGSQAALGLRVKLNPVTGDVVVLGGTDSPDFKPAPTTLQTTYAGGSCVSGIICQNAFLIGLDPSTGALRYGTFFGSPQYSVMSGLAIDATGDIYLSGSAALPLSSSLGSATHIYAPTSVTTNGVAAVVARLHLTGAALSTSYLTAIQADSDGSAQGIAVDALSNVYFAGSTAALHLPVTSGVFQSTTVAKPNYSCDSRGTISELLTKNCGTAFAGKLSSTGALSFLTYIGGSGQDIAQGIGVDSLGDIWISGDTTSNDFPFSTDAYAIAANETGTDIPFLAELSSDGSHLPFATSIAAGIGQAADIKIDSNNNVYLSGSATAVQTSPNVYPANPNVYNPAFVQKWGLGPQPVLSLSGTALTFPATARGGKSPSQTITAQNTGLGTLELSLQAVTATYNATPPAGFLESDNCGVSLAPGASCAITVTFQPGTPSPTCLLATGCDPNSPTGLLIINTNAATGTQNITLSGTTGAGAGVSVSPNPVVFTPQAAGTTSAAMAVTLLSNGDVPLSVTGANITGTNASDFQISSMGTCANSTGGCILNVVFSPSASATGTRTASLVLSDNAGDSPQSIPMSGLVTGPGAALLVSPTTAFEGTSVIGAAAITSQLQITLTNPSTDTDIQLTSLTLSGANKADFAIVPVTYPTTLPITIAKGTSLKLAVNFQPAAGADGLRTASLAIGTSPAIAGLPTVALSGDALTNSDPIFSYISVPTPQDFGSLQVGESSTLGNELSITAQQNSSYLCNGDPATVICGGPLTITSFVTGLSDYTVVIPQQNGYCTTPPLTIPAGDTCYFRLVFTPNAAGNRNSTLTINSNDPMGPTIIPLLGKGLALPLGNLSSTSLNFGYSAVGVPSPPLPVTLQNSGQSNLTVSGVTASANYSIASNGCTAALIPGAACTIQVTFTPPSTGDYSGSLTISDNDYFSGQQTVALSGTGATGALLRISSPTLSFGSQNLGTTSAAQTITLTSTGTSAVTFPTNALRLSNTDYLMTTTCGTSLAPGASCTATLQFKPTNLYTDDASLLIADNAMGTPQPIYVSGYGATAGGTPTVTLTTSVNPIAVGQPLTLAVTVAGISIGSPVPTGRVDFYNYVTPLGSVTLNASGKASVTTSALTSGSQTVSAIYDGDSNYASNYSNVIQEVVNPATNTPSTTTLISSSNPSPGGQLLVLTATVAPTAVVAGSNVPIPSGTVVFMDGSTTLGTITMNSAGQALFSYTSPSSGSHTITAVYAGNGTYAGSTSAVLTQVVNTSTKTGTTTSLMSSLNPSTTGQSVTFTATVASTGSSTPAPTGSVTFLDGGVALSTLSLNGSAQASLTTSSLALGSHSITAVYSADINYNASTSAALVEAINAAAKTSTTNMLVSSMNPATTGQSIVFTVTVAGVGTNTPLPTGTITFLDGATTLGTGMLTSGQTTFASSTLAAGSHSITTAYGGDTNYSASTSMALTQVVNAPVKVNTNTLLSSSLNPATVGQSIVFTATIVGVGGNTPVPTGTVTFLDGMATLGTGALNGSGQATFTTSTLAVGSHSLTAAYGGNTSYAVSTSTLLAQVINPAAKIATTTLLVSSLNPATLGQSVVFTATVAGVGSNTPVPTGTVTFLDGAATLGTGTTNAAGVATFTTTTLAGGVHTIAAQYGGDTNYIGSTTTSTLTETINLAPGFAVAFNPTALTVTRGQSGTVNITITSVGAFSQPVGFACSNLPQFTSCTFNPSTVTPTSGTPVTSTLTIATNVGVASTSSRPVERSEAGRVWSAGLLMGLGLLTGLRRQKQRGSKYPWTGNFLLLLVLLTGVAALQLAGCGSAQKQTPTGTNAITITATSGANQVPTMISLTVQ